MDDVTPPKITVNDTILKYLVNISRLEDRIYNLPFKGNWSNDLTEFSIEESATKGFLLDTYDPKVSSNYAQISYSNLSKKDLIIANEGEVRRSFPLYFKTDKLNVETVEYLHRFLDNLNDSLSTNRGKFRKSQKDIQEFFNLPNLKKVIPRYGFIKRLLDRFFSIINESEKNEYLLAGYLFINFLKIAPFMRGNLRVARILSKGFLYSRGIDTKNYVCLERIFSQDMGNYYKILNFYLKEDDITGWLEFYLKNFLLAYKDTAKQMQKISGGTLNPLSNEVVTLTKRQKTIVELLKKHEQLSGSEIAEILKVSRQNIFVIMQKLMKKGVVKRIGKGTTSRYKLNLKY